MPRRSRAESLLGRVQEADEASKRFVEQRGFILVSRECRVALDLTRFGGPPPEPPAGVAIASIAERPDLERAAYEVEVETIGDIPVGPEAPTPRPFAAWRTETIEVPGALPGLSLVALEGDDVVGWSGLVALGEEGGPRPPHRGAAERPWPGHRDSDEARAGPAREGGRAASDRDDERRGKRTDACRRRPAWLRGRARLAARARPLAG